VVYPFTEEFWNYLGIHMGYFRLEDLNTATGDYLRRYEGYAFGLRYRIPLHRYWDLGLHGELNHGEYYEDPDPRVSWETRGRVYATINLNLGGGR
jgi:hypothetical protein